MSSGSRARSSSAAGHSRWGSGSSRTAVGRVSDGVQDRTRRRAFRRADDVARITMLCTVQLIACTVQRVVPCMSFPSPVRSTMTTPVATPGAAEPVDRDARACAPSRSRCPGSCGWCTRSRPQAAKNDSGDRAALVLLFPLVRLGPAAAGRARRTRARRPLDGQPARGRPRRARPGPAGGRRVRRPGQPAARHRRRPRRPRRLPPRAREPLRAGDRRLGRRRPRDLHHPVRPLPRRHVRDDTRRPRRLHARRHSPTDLPREI